MQAEFKAMQTMVGIAHLLKHTGCILVQSSADYERDLQNFMSRWGLGDEHGRMLTKLLEDLRHKLRAEGRLIE